MAVCTFNKDNFTEEVLKSDKPVLVDFWASWCGPCRMFAPIIDAVAEEYPNEVKVGKINVDESLLFQTLQGQTILIQPGGLRIRVDIHRIVRLAQHRQEGILPECLQKGQLQLCDFQ